MSQPSSVSNPVLTSKLVRVIVLVSAALFVSSLTSCIGLYMAFNKSPSVIAATDDGRVIPVVPLDKPYLTDSRVIAFSEECARRSFSHDFKNFRMTLNEASRCFTSDGAKMYLTAMEDIIKDVEARRMIMSVSMEPPVIVEGPQLIDGRATWHVQAKMQLFREGQRERITPQSYVLDLNVVRVALEENPRGIAANGFIVRPFVN